jgi:outer membrane protein assembly factor BamB
LVSGVNWPENLATNRLQKAWRTELGPSYSGPLVRGQRVFVTESRNQETEAALALDRASGRVVWRTEWPGYVKVPFFARANGDWIRATPALDEERLYVAGMRDLLVCLDASDGKTLWTLDAVKQTGSPVPDFGFVSSPLVVGDSVYVQAAAAFVRVDKRTGAIRWRVLQDSGGMWGSAFSSPIHATLAGQPQFVVQTREKLAGIHPDTGRVLWEQPIKAFRGMNILTPVVLEDTVFTSAYGGQAQQYRIRRDGDQLRVDPVWQGRTEAYMCTPVVINRHAYLHLRNERFACLDLDTGRERWATEKKYGKYWSLVASTDRIVALDQRGWLHLLKPNPDQFELLDSRRVAEHESWAHLAVAGDDLYIRDLQGLTAWTWR